MSAFGLPLLFAQLPHQFARIPEHRFQPPAEGLMGRLHRRVPDQVPGPLYCPLA
jgi:hypothetical protein